MPVILRQPNNPNTMRQILFAMKTILPGYPTANTRLAQISTDQTGQERIYVQQRYMTITSTASFPLLHLSGGQQAYSRMSLRSYDGSVRVRVRYYDRWDQQALQQDAIRDLLDQDIELMKANLEDNESLVIGQAKYAVGLPHIELSPYEGEFDTSLSGLTLIYRTMDITVSVLPYDV